CRVAARRSPRPPLFPYTTLFRSRPLTRQLVHGRILGPVRQRTARNPHASGRHPGRELVSRHPLAVLLHVEAVGRVVEFGALLVQDRKSTRLNSSHVKISYAVFCL